MITFKQFLAETVSTSKRKSMLHLQNMKPIEFVKYVRSMHSEFGGVLKGLDATLKVDGLGARFGKDINGSFFFEGSNTGPVFDDDAFSKHAISKGSKDEIVARAKHYDRMFGVLKSSAVLNAIPNDTKLVCEIFYNPMATITGDSAVFVTVKYDTKNQLGSLMTIVPIQALVASTGEVHPESADIIGDALSASSSEIKVVSPKLKVGTIDVRAQIADVLKLGDRELQVLGSLKGADKAEKSALIQVIQTAKDQLAKYLLDHPSIKGKDVLGKDIEGLVLTIGDQPVKVTTQEFKDSKKKGT